MAVIAFARTEDGLRGPWTRESGRRLIEVAETSRAALVRLLGGPSGRLTTMHLAELRAIRAAERYNSDLDLLIELIEREGEAAARFL